MGSSFQIVLGQASQDGAKLPTAFKLFNMSQKEKTLQELIKDKWLCQTSSDQIGLGIRSFFDLRGWFRTNEVPSCDVCNEAGVKVCWYWYIQLNLFMCLVLCHISMKTLTLVLQHTWSSVLLTHFGNVTKVDSIFMYFCIKYYLNQMCIRIN